MDSTNALNLKSSIWKYLFANFVGEFGQLSSFIAIWSGSIFVNLVDLSVWIYPSTANLYAKILFCVFYLPDNPQWVEFINRGLTE